VTGAEDEPATRGPVGPGPARGPVGPGPAPSRPGPTADAASPRAPAPGLRLRPVEAADGAFLLELYASTRAGELAATGWDEATRAAFIAQQFTAQDRDWRARLPDAAYDLVCVGEQRVGRRYVDRSAAAIHVVDVSLLPQWRGHGIGGWLLAGLVAEADAAGVPLTLHVERSNPALRLYARWGLRPTAGDAIHLFLERPPRAVAHAGPGGEMTDG